MSDRVDELRAALRDIALGAQMMDAPLMPKDTRRYAAEVHRVAFAALKADDEYAAKVAA